MSDDILSRIDEAMARNADRFHPFGPRPAKTITEKVADLGEALADLDEWLGHSQCAIFRCRGCRLWIVQDVQLCGPCSALPSCLAERFSAEWGGLAACFRPDGHDGQHESVQGRCWMDPPALVEVEGHMEVRREGPWTIIDETHIWRAAADPRAEVAVATPEEAAEHTRTMETRSLECSRSRPMCSGCDGAAAWGSSPCLHDCHDADALPADAASDPDPVAPRRRLTDLYTALKVRRTRRGGAK